MKRIYAVYLDIFIMQNFLIDGLCMLGVKVLLREQKKYGFLYLLLGSMLGTLLGTGAFFLIHNFFMYQAVIYLAVQPLTIFCSLRPCGWKQFLKQMICCYILYFLMGGVWEFLLIFLGNKSTFFLPASVLLFAAVLLGLHVVEKRRSHMCTCVLINGSAKEEGTAISDSGNLLRDPISGRPVSVVSELWKNSLEIRPEKIRVIPYHTVSGQSELMEAAVIPVMLLKTDGEIREYGPVMIGFADPAVFAGKRYCVILNKEYDI